MIVTLLAIGCSGASPSPDAVELGGPRGAASSAPAEPPMTFDYTPDRVGDKCREASFSRMTRTLEGSPTETNERESEDLYEILAVADGVSVKERLSWPRKRTSKDGVDEVFPITIGTQYMVALDDRGEEVAFTGDGGPLEKPIADWIVGNWRVGKRDELATAMHGVTIRSGSAAPQLADYYRDQLPPGATLREERYTYVGRDERGAKFTIEIDADFRWEVPGTFTQRTTLWLTIPRGTPAREERSATIVRRGNDGKALRVEAKGWSEDACEGR